MKTKLFALLFALIAILTLSSCEGTSKIYSEQFDFVLSADCDEAGLKKIETLYKSDKLKLPVGPKSTISIIVDIDSNPEDNKILLQQKVLDILKLSSTRIYANEFHAQKTGATMTVYSAFSSIDGKEIGSVTTDFGNLPYNN